MEEKMAIMVVDDGLIVREFFVQWFRKSGHRAEAAAFKPECDEGLSPDPIMKISWRMLYLASKRAGVVICGRIVFQSHD